LGDAGLDARWDGDALCASDPEDRWRPVRIAPNRHGLYEVGAFGRPVREGSGYLRQWEEVVPLPRDRPLDAETIARALDSGLALGPAFDRIEAEVDVDTLIEALERAESDHARERLSILLAQHPDAMGAVGALPRLGALLEGEDADVRAGAEYAIAEIRSRTGLDAGRELDDPEAVRFARQVREALDFLREEHDFSEPAIEHDGFSTRVTYRNDTTAVAAHADWRDGVVEVFLVKLERDALPVYADTELTHWLAPSQLLDELVRGSAEQGMAAPGDADATRRELATEAAALRRCDDVLRGDFTRFDQALT
jgi:hypothetical protein